MAKSTGCESCNDITGSSTIDLLNQDLAKQVRGSGAEADLAHLACQEVEEPGLCGGA